MQYLVTGATGLLGNNIVRQLLARGEPVRILVRAGSGPLPLAGLDVERVTGDVRDAQVVQRACDGANVVFHCAGYVRIGWTEMELARAINVEGTRNVAAAARQAGARLVHVSTVNALGLGHLDDPADEHTALPGIVECPYVVTKREAEQVVLGEVDGGLWATIVNPATMFGPWDWKPSSGQMILEVARFAPLAPPGAGNFCDARDVASGTIAAARLGQSGRRYILGGFNLTYGDVWQRIARLAGKRGPRLRMGPIIQAIGMSALSLATWFTGREGLANSATIAMSRQQHCFGSERAMAELGYAIRPLEQTLNDAWAWFLKHGYVR